MFIKIALLWGFLTIAEIKSTSGFVILRIGGSIRPRPSPESTPGRSRTPTNGELISDIEGSGIPEEDDFLPRQLHPNTMSEVLICPRVANRIPAQGGSCPRGWTNSPECDQPDKSNIGVCEWNDASKFELPNTLATLRAVLCRYKRMKCLAEAGVIPGDIQLLHAPRNALSDKFELAEIMSNIKKVVAVDFARNNFFELSSKTFESNSCLRSVNFDLNFMLDIPEDIFYHNKVLTSVSLAGNKLDYIPPRMFHRNPILIIVNFERNNITLLAPEVFRRNRRLEVVRLTGNAIPKIPPGLFSTNPRLREIGLARNRISVVPKMLFHNARNLRNVRLSGNKITSLPVHLFDNCQELRSVALDRNMITSLPAKLFYRNPKLSHVDISYNRFHVVSSELFANNPVVSVVNKRWEDHEGLLEEEDDDGEWKPAQRYPPEEVYRKSLLTPSS